MTVNLLVNNKKLVNAYLLTSWHKWVKLA